MASTKRPQNTTARPKNGGASPPTTSKGSTQSSRLNEIRQRTGTNQAAGRGAARRAAKRQSPWRGKGPIIATLAAVVLLVVGFVVFAQAQQGSSSTSGIGAPLPASIYNQVTGVSSSVSNTVGTGGLPDPLRSISGSSTALTNNGKPEFLYIGGEFCPYCAAERWSMTIALSRFGTFSNLHQMASAANDGNYSTLTYHGSSYTSKYISFVPVENEDRSQNQLEPLTSQQQQILATVGNNGYPTLDIAGQYSNNGSQYSGGYDPALLNGLTWSQIGSKLSNPNDPVTKAVVGNANYLTAAICKVTNNQPASACTPQIQQIEAQLPK